MTSPIIIPRSLKPGDTIAFISPSARLNEKLPTPLSRSVDFFEKQGYPVKVIFSPEPTTSELPKYLAKAKHVANEVHEAFLDDTVSCIISTIGGTTNNEILRHLDYDLIRKHPKIFVGYSDNTHLIYALYVKAGLRSFYGPCIFTEFAEFPVPDPFTVNHFFQVVTGQGIVGKQIPYSSRCVHLELPFFDEKKGNTTEEVRQTIPTPSPKFLRPGKATGPVFGGCLRKLVALSGSPFVAPSMHKGAILFLEISQGEDGPMPLYRVRADLVDLINTGLFDEIIGLVFGRTYLYDEKATAELESLLTELADGHGYEWPVLTGVDVGHTSPMITVPFGAQASLDSENNSFCFLEEGVL